MKRIEMGGSPLSRIMEILERNGIEIPTDVERQLEAAIDEYEDSQASAHEEWAAHGCDDDADYDPETGWSAHDYSYAPRNDAGEYIGYM